MILGNQVEWALHCCTILAAMPEETYIPTKTLAEFHGVPKEYLSKAMQSLSQAGIVATLPGARGGYRLAHSASMISLLQVVEAIEGKKSTFKCQEIRRNNPCVPQGKKDRSVCAIARAMYGADQAWRDHLRAVTLADILQSVENDVPTALWQKSLNWVQAKPSAEN